MNPLTSLSRRDFVQGGLGLGGAWLVGGLAACAGALPAATSVPAGPQATGADGWASGGTKAMQATYPDPFTTRPAEAACTVLPELTVGPCYAQTVLRQDISEGYTGLPLRLSLRVVKAGTCEPVPNATVDIWHTNASGYYSAYAKGSMCNPNDADAAAKHFFRGVQATDANGRVDFHTVYPGWYSGRTVHVHFTVRIGDQAYTTSQLFFDDTLTDQIMAKHPDYNGRPARDTTNKNDSVLGSQDANTFIVSTAKLSDGVLQAWKTIAIKS